MYVYSVQLAYKLINVQLDLLFFFTMIPAITMDFLLGPPINFTKTNEQQRYDFCCCHHGTHFS